MVMLGMAKDLPGHPPGIQEVAVKMLKYQSNQILQKALLGEIKIMAYIGSHLNIVNFFGAVTQNMGLST